MVNKDDLELGFPPEKFFGEPDQNIQYFRKDEQQVLKGELIHNPHYGQLPSIDCYPGLLNQVFMNIISNAIDALEEKNKSQISTKKIADISTIQIQTEVCRENWVAIHMIDNGHGISETIREQLFDPFFTTKSVGKGTGLGLSISYKIIVEKH